MDAFQKANSGMTVKINTVDHNTFQENINNYLQGKPDDVFTWFAGYRMRFFAAKGLAGDISDVWKDLAGISDAFKKASTGDDGKQYFVPSTVLPVGGVLPQERLGGEGLPGAQDPRRVQGPRRPDEEGRPRPDRLRRQGRLAGDGHLRHPQPAHQRLPVPRRPDGRQGGLDRPQGQEGLRHLGRAPRRCTSPTASAAPGRRPPSRCSRRRPACTCSACSSPSSSPRRRAGRPRLLHLPRDRLDHRRGRDRRPDRRLHDGQAARRTRPAPRSCWSTSARPTAQNIVVKADPSVIATNTKADTSGYTALQKKSAELVGRPSRIAQFLDRDTRPDFASTVMIPAIQPFIKNPKDIDGLVNEHREPEEDHLRLLTRRRGRTPCRPAADHAGREGRAGGTRKYQRRRPAAAPPSTASSSRSWWWCRLLLVCGWSGCRRSARCLLSFTNWDGIGPLSAHQVGRAAELQRRRRRSTRRSCRPSSTT